MHANHLRKFYARVDVVVCDQEFMSFLTDYSDDLDVLNVNSSSCANVHDNDVDFGDIHVIEPSVVSSNIVNDLLPSQKIDLSVLSHLSVEQTTEFLALLDRFPECFF